VGQSEELWVSRSGGRTSSLSLHAARPPLQSRNRPIADFYGHKFHTPSPSTLCDTFTFAANVTTTPLGAVSVTDF
jgi:hypothetical protein